MQLQKVWYWGVLGVVLGVLVGNVDRFVFSAERAEGGERRVESGVRRVESGETDIRTSLESPSEQSSSPTLEVSEAPNETSSEPEEEEKPALEVLRVVVEKTRVVVAFSAGWRIYNCNSRTVSVEPKVDNLRIETDWNGRLLLTGDFKGETTYTLHLKPEIRSSEAELKAPFSTTFYVEQPLMMAPSVQFLSWGQFLPLHRAELPYEVINLDNLSLSLERAYENNLATLGTSGWEARGKMAHVTVAAIDLKEVQPNTPLVKMLDVGALAKGRPGYYRLETYGINKEMDESDSTEIDFFLTDLGVVYAYDATGDFRVAVYRLSDGTPVTGAVVEVISNKAQTQFMGATGADGIAALTMCAEVNFQQEEPESILVTAGEDMTYVRLSRHIHQYGMSLEMGEVKPLRAMAWADRGAVRPGERVMCAVIARDKDLKALANVPLEGVVTNARGTTVQTVKVTTDAHGFARFETQVPAESASGSNRVSFFFDSISVAETTFYVSDFVPDRMRVGITFGEGNTVAVDAKTYFGTEVDGARGRVAVRGVAQREVSQWKGWSLGRPDVADEVLVTETVTTVAGKPLVIGYETPKATADAPVRINASVTLSEPGGRAVTATTFKTEYLRERYVGVREEKDTVQLKLLAQKDAVVPAEEATLTLIRHDWDYLVVREGIRYRYKWEERKTPIALPESTVTLTTDAVTTPDFTTLDAGRYTLTVRLKDGLTTEYVFWHAAGSAGKRSANPSVLTFATDKATYLPGETATLTFNVPAEGTLLLCEGAGELQGMHTQRVAAGEVTVTTQVPLTLTHEKWAVGVTYIADKSEKQARLFGLAELPVALEDGYGLKVAIDAPERARPGETTTVKLRLTTPEGKPATGTVMLYAVDEGILALTNYKVPNPLAQLAKMRGCGFNLGDIYGDLYPALRLLPDGRIGGGVKLEAAPCVLNATDSVKRARAKGADDEEAELEMADLPRILCAPIVVDASGVAEVTAVVPDFQGALRWMAVAANETRMGAAETEMVVRSDATMLASTVRFGCPGDTAQVALQIANHDLEDGTYELLLNNTVIETGTLAKGATKTVYHTTAVEPLTATFRIGGQELTASLPVQVRPAVPEVKATTFKLLGAGEAVPEGAVKLDSTKAVLSPVLDWLALYPYRCTEQLSARVLPYLFRAQLTPAEAAFVANTTSHLLARLDSNGDFAVWQGARYVNSEASLLAAFVLLKAEAQGQMTLDAATHKRLCDLLQFYATALQPDARGTAAFATWALAEVGERLSPTSARNLLATSQDDGAAFLAAVALVRAGYAGEGAPILRQLLGADKTRAPVLAGYMDEAAQRALEVALALHCGLGAELSEQTLATFFTAPRETTQQNAWTAVALEALGTAMPQGTLVRMTETVAAVRPNQPIQVKRTFVDASGTPVTTLEHGALVYLRVDISMPRDCADVAIRDLLPGGLEVEDRALATREDAQLPAWAKDLKSTFRQEYVQNLGSELRRFGFIGEGETTLLVPVRAVTRGTFAIPATTVEAMYEPTLTGAAGGEGTITIE